ncbi:MAG: cupin domain-containing protein [Nitrososphaera sp.]|nr:cupin domain-containing protein [Nitrososphaera sp.]
MFFKHCAQGIWLKARDWVKKLGLAKHPEGGYFRETFRSKIQVSAPGFSGKRSASTAIYYLLESGRFSAFHRIKSDELWHLYAGSPLVLHVIENGKMSRVTLGRGQAPQAAVRAGCWFAASVARPGSYSLAGCTVAPGFDFADWEMGKREELLREYPDHRRIIERYTR